MPYVVGKYGNDCECFRFAMSGDLKYIADYVIDRTETAFFDDMDPEKCKTNDYCEFSDYGDLKKAKTDEEYEKILRNYSFYRSDMYCEVTSYANDNDEELAALLKEEYDDYEEGASSEELEDMFCELESYYDD